MLSDKLITGKWKPGKLKPRCEHQITIIIRGKWGPHRAKKVCVDCYKHLKWCKASK